MQMPRLTRKYCAECKQITMHADDDCNACRGKRRELEKRALKPKD